MLRNRLIIIIGGLLAILWGIAHIIPARSLVKGFSNISFNNIQTITIEWIVEGLTLVFLGVLVIVITNHVNNPVAKIVYLLSSLLLFTMAILSPFTGFWTDFLPYKLCPTIFSASALMISQGIFSKEFRH
jgi:hypothetical protein